MTDSSAIIVSHGQPSEPEVAEDELARFAAEVSPHLPGWRLQAATLAQPGALDAALATANSADWDLAAAVLLVQEAGGRVTDLHGAPIRLNQASVKHPAFVAAGPRLHDAILAAARGEMTV